ncbi:PEP-CTERM sorting domain-containing protein [Mucisphaera calidilacus]|uniref:PEP-CTERM protein-sorting domain-containing protein n=1 Tax=Mucisphaera calidilacus TaxID=2527982 RepID=A0A518BX38_9BACT|nr:PEP-CTERM sorting domain-containing protein [Mucisphaera calidilacus]QDU71531.1 hypothetical protein Pan265_13810 [Mucisphaera calidilacus]
MRTACTTATLLVATLGLTANAQTPKVLISDAFERVTGNADPENGPTLSDWGANDNALGGGILQTYITTPTRGGTGGVDQTVQEADGDEFDGDLDNEGVIRFGTTMVDYDLASDPDVLFGGGYTVSFDFRRLAGFLSFYIGYDPVDAANTDGGAAFGPVTSGFAGEHAWIFQDDGLGTGRMQLFESGNQLLPPGDINGAFGISTELHTTLITVSAPDGFDTGDLVTASVSVDGSPVLDATHTVASDGMHFGYVGWSANSGNAQIDNLVIASLDTAPEGLEGDFNNDGVVDDADIDIIAAAIGGGSSDLKYDLDSSGTVDAADLDAMITDVIGTLFGDANLDQTVDLLDLSALASNFEGTAGWAGGNFNTDTSVDLLDLSTLASNFNQSAPTVPEPTALVMLTIGAATIARRR